MTLTGVVAREIGTSLEQLSLTEQLREIAASEQRLRVARDLHDGVLQSLTGIRLELQRRRGRAQTDASPSQRHRLLAHRAGAGHRAARAPNVHHSLKPHEEARCGHALLVNLDALRERVALEWKVPLTIRVGPRVAAIPTSIERAIPPMVHEAVVNALKHGEPSRIRVDLDVADGVLRIIVGDDGHGFPFRGRYDHTALERGSARPACATARRRSAGR